MRKSKIVLVLLLLICLLIPGTMGEIIQKRTIQTKNQYKDDRKEFNQNIISCTKIRGWLLNPVIKTNSIQGKAIYIRCRDISYDGAQAYVINGFEDVSFRNGPFIQIRTMGRFGTFGYVNGIYFH